MRRGKFRFDHRKNLERMKGNPKELTVSIPLSLWSYGAYRAVLTVSSHMELMLCLFLCHMVSISTVVSHSYCNSTIIFMKIK